MRKGMNRIVIAILLVFAIANGLSAQQKPVEQQPKEQAKPGLAPGVSKTKGEIDDARNAVSTRETVVTAAPVDPKKYIIGPEDVLFIRVWDEPKFTEPVQVRPDGKFSMPLIGDIIAAGLTPEQLSENITKSLSEYINKPEVLVTVQSVQSKKYYIMGEVNRTGAFPLIVPTTILEALTNAGGFREYANPKRIIIMRGRERIKFNYKEVIKGKNLEQNILVLDGDYIQVP
jgi:polysaccharide export outer membrane protein